MPRRYYEYPPEFQVLNVMSTAGASILAVGYVLPLVYLTLSLWFERGRRAEPLGRLGPGVADLLAAAEVQLRRDPRRHRRPLRLPARRAGRSRRTWLRPPTRHADRARAHGHGHGHGTTRTSRTTSTTSSQQHDVGEPGDVGLPGTEVMFFGGLFVSYIVYRFTSPDVWGAASKYGLNVALGTINTVVLLTSSLAMALAVHAGRDRRPQAPGPLPAGDAGPRRRCSWGSRGSSITRSTTST